MCDLTVPSLIYQSFRSYLKDSLLASCLPIQLKRSATKIPVGVSSSPLNGDRCAEGLGGHSSCSQRARFVCSCFAGSIGGLRHGRSLNSSASTGLFLSDRGISTTMVSILTVKPATARTSGIFLLITWLHGVWCTPGFLGAIPFLLYCGDLQLIIERHGLCPHLYADDSQIYGSYRPAA